MGTGNPPPNLDPVRNSHTLNPTLIFQDSSAPDCRVPHVVQDHVARGIVAMFEVLTGFMEKVLQTVEIEVCVEYPPAERSKRVRKLHADRGGNTPFSSTTSTPLLCVGDAKKTALDNNNVTTYSISHVMTLSPIIKPAWEICPRWSNNTGERCIWSSRSCQGCSAEYSWTRRSFLNPPRI